MMRIYPIAATKAALGIGLVLLLAQGTSTNAQGGGAPAPSVANAKPGDVRVMAITTMRAPIEAIRAEAEKAIGHPLMIQYGPARGSLRTEILAGQGFEVTILIPDLLDELAKEGKIVAASRFDVARVDVAVGQRGDAPKLDIGTVEALKKAILGAKSVKWNATGAAMPGVNKILDVLQVRDAIKDRANLPGQVALAPGEYELLFNPLSEIMVNKAVQNLGAVPTEVNVPVVMSGAIGANAADVPSAEALVKFLQGPTILPALKTSGMMR